ncbi:hypothetical protein QF041_004344 [Paenibacillus sp. W2I17]|nr:hypothetical protein [Paenibacillus sp. W2I17]
MKNETIGLLVRGIRIVMIWEEVEGYVPYKGKLLIHAEYVLR